MTPVVASLQLLAPEAGAASLFICSSVSPFPHRRHCWCATATLPEPLVLLLPHPRRLRQRPSQTGIKTESLAMLMSRHIAENNSAPSGVSGQSQMYLYLFSHFEQGQLSQGNQEMELMAWLFSTSFLNDTEAIWLANCYDFSIGIWQLRSSFWKKTLI